MIAENPLEEFSPTFLKSTLLGKRHMNGWWAIDPKQKDTEITRQFPHLTSFLMLERDHQPLLPGFPGDHGAQITGAVEIDQEDPAADGNVAGMPLFIRQGNGGYKYYGMYGEPLYSDRLSANEMRGVPQHVKSYWARRMGAKPKPKWAVDEIRKARPWKVGWLGKDKKAIIEHDEELEMFNGEPLRHPSSMKEIQGVGVNDILKAFEAVSCPLTLSSNPVVKMVDLLIFSRIWAENSL
jgi:hypothetical protein